MHDPASKMKKNVRNDHYTKRVSKRLLRDSRGYGPFADLGTEMGKDFASEWLESSTTLEFRVSIVISVDIFVIYKGIAHLHSE